ncbi:RNA polymerase sigma factor [Actinoplanes oblitus]|uniref:RNA polymerase sigma factor n=1 Tax=Actinoplanes oblitus TaxID=3040509 RepID=A0ABY8WBD9_9ACTN|nr:RNA polymerase sigma factor [Actinoplanes oblitus]WIM95179.1 RNA polymerase sigma factor [Actinoplanes oblitus]
MIEVRARVGVVWKQESARIIATLLRMVHDVGLAEELAQDALVAAMEQWPVDGVPDNPGAWLTTIARRKAVDHLRRAQRFDGTDIEPRATAEESSGDDVLRLMFISCHPVLDRDARVALTLRVVAGLSPAEIARAFLVGEPVVAQRIAAAKRTLAESGVAYGLPSGAESSGRLASVLEVVYLVFNEGYAATSGDDLMRPGLCLEALRLGRLLAELAPDEPEVHGLVALMEIQQSRSAARTGPRGEPVQLHEQNRGRWDRLLINRGFAAMLRARAAGAGRAPGPYVLQAAIAVCHAQARTAEETDWGRIATLYGALERLLPTPVVRLNRAVAVGFAAGPEAGLALVDALRADPVLRDYHLLPGVRGDLLLRVGRVAEARLELERAASLTRNAAERDFLRARAEGGAGRAGAGPMLGAAVDEFVAGLGGATAHAYRKSLGRLRRILGERTPLAALDAAGVAAAVAAIWPDAAPRSWNRHLAAVRSFSAWAGFPDLAAGLRNRAVPDSAGIVPGGLPDLAGVPVRERVLWAMVRESAAPIGAVLALDVDALDLAGRRGPGVTWGERTAALLPELIGSRTRGPLFLSDRRPAPARRPQPADLCPETGRRRLSYERAAHLFKQATGRTLRTLSDTRRGRSAPAR